MEECPQFIDKNGKIFNVYQHGISVKDYLKDLLEYLKTGNCQKEWKLPKWVNLYSQELLQNILPWETLENYTVFHDCGKVFCRTIDEYGKQHFPNHAEISAETWLRFGGSFQEVELMRLDMEIHQLKAEGVEQFAKRPEAISLLLTGLCEITSNAILFGGVESTSFKIKWKQIDKRGRAICELLFGKKNNENHNSR